MTEVKPPIRNQEILSMTAPSFALQSTSKVTLVWSIEILAVVGLQMHQRCEMQRPVNQQWHLIGLVVANALPPIELILSIPLGHFFI